MRGAERTGKPETGDLLINSNRDVAIIHDLWNLDKHAELNRPSRSGLSPRLQPARTTLEFKVTTSEETPLITIPVFGGPIQAHGDANVRITATVVDKDGNVLVEVYDRMGKKIGDIPDGKTSSTLRDALQQTFQSAISPDHDGVIAII